MDKGTNCVLNAIIIGIVLNLVLPMILFPFATSEEKKPPSGAANLSFKSQFMHMMVHHKQVPFVSSVIIAIIVGLAVYLGYVLDPMKYVTK